MKKFILKCVPDIYFKRLKHNIAAYKNVIFLQFMQLMENDFSASPEEQDEIKTALHEE